MKFRQTALAFAALAFAGRAFSQAPADKPALPVRTTAPVAPAAAPGVPASDAPVPGLPGSPLAPGLQLNAPPPPTGVLGEPDLLQALPPLNQPASTDNPLGRFTDIPIDISSDHVSRQGNIATASGNVQITHGSTTIYSDEASYDLTTREVIVTGNVRVYREGKLITTDRAVYNLETNDITAATVRGDSQPFRFQGVSFQNIPGSKGYAVRNATFTTSDSSHPDWAIRAKRVRIYPDDRVVFENAKLYIGDTPIFWFPYLYQPLTKANAFLFTPGYSSVWGAYALSSYSFPLMENTYGTVRLDLRDERGPAIGFDTDWESGERKQNYGKFRSYYLNDSNPGLNRTALDREPIDAERYRVTFKARQYLTEDIYASVDINKLSDARFLQDFFEGEFRDDPTPDNQVTLTKLGSDYELSLIARAQLNEFFDMTERTPELALDIIQQPFLDSKFFYQGETSVGHYRRDFADGSLEGDYGAVRLDSFHQWSRPYVYDGWLSIVPKAGVRATWYSNSGPIVPVIETETQTLTDGTKKEVTHTFHRLQEEGDLFRPVANAGLEMSFKTSKAWENVQSRTWGLDGLRHVVQPYLNFSLVTSGSDNKDVLQFDRIQRNTQPSPIDFPTFNTLDSIDDWNIVRLGVRNRLQTRRDNNTINWFEMDTFFDIRFDLPDFGLEPDPGTFSNIVNRLRWAPLSWVSFTLDCQLPLLDKGFTEVNTRAVFFVNDQLQFNVGHRYINDNILFQDSSLLDFSAYYRLNDNWAFSLRESYEFNDSLLESQRYEIHRDLSSWVASLGAVVRTNSSNGKEVNDYGVVLTFTLKDLPDVKVPVNFDPSGQSGAK